MTPQPVLIDGEWRPSASPATTFSAVAPATGAALPALYPVSTFAEVEVTLAAAHRAVADLRTTPVERLAAFLDTYADNIEADRERIVAAAHDETALPEEPRLNSVELTRTTDQLRQAAAATRDRSWTTATIDTATNIRSKLSPLGSPVVVFGPNNFPLAFNAVAGGDFAAAVAAGNPVISIGHPSHPTTTRLLAEAAFEAVRSTGLPAAVVQLMYRMAVEDGLALAGDRRVGAIGFTGSRRSGLALKEAADAAGTPIYLEMSSVNPVFVLPGALAERSDDIASELYASCTLGVGQFCTCPGLVVVPEGPADEFIAAVGARFGAGDPGILLTAPDHLSAAVGSLTSAGATIRSGGTIADGDGYVFDNTLLTISGDEFLRDPVTFQTEAFGPVALVVVAAGVEQMLAIAGELEGNLTGTLYTDTGGSDDDTYDRLEPVLRRRVGRLLNDKMPTGVAVTAAMNHGGPYPATGHPGYTSVGLPASMRRFAALHCYDNVRQRRLPIELRDPNPSGAMWRLIDGDWSQADVT